MIETNGGAVEADQVVVSAGAWAGKLLGRHYDRTLVPYLQVLHWYPSTDPALHEPGRMPVYIWVHGEQAGAYFYGFPSLPDRGETKLGIEQDTSSCDPDTVDRTIAAADGPGVYAAHVAGRIAGLGSTPSRSATCLYTITPDSGFVIERHVYPAAGRRGVALLRPRLQAFRRPGRGCGAVGRARAERHQPAAVRQHAVREGARCLTRRLLRGARYTTSGTTRMSRSFPSRRSTTVSASPKRRPVNATRSEPS